MLGKNSELMCLSFLEYLLRNEKAESRSEEVVQTLDSFSSVEDYFVRFKKRFAPFAHVYYYRNVASRIHLQRFLLTKT